MNGSNLYSIKLNFKVVFVALTIGIRTYVLCLGGRWRNRWVKIFFIQKLLSKILGLIHDGNKGFHWLIWWKEWFHSLANKGEECVSTIRFIQSIARKERQVQEDERW